MAEIHAPEGANKKKTIVGRGASSKGRACGRGHDGQNSRSGGGVRPGFEGGQMPLYRRVARRGFSNYPFKKEYETVSLSSLNEVFKAGEVVTNQALRDRGLIKGIRSEAKILSDDCTPMGFIIDGVRISVSAGEKIKAAGGEIR